MDSFIRAFLSPRVKRYIFGCTVEAKALIDLLKDDGLPVCAVIDNYYLEPEFHGLPRVILDDVPPDALILSAVTNSRPVEVNKLLASRRFTYSDYFTFYRESGYRCPDIPVWDTPKKHFSLNRSRYSAVRELFSDSESQKTFDAIVNFRNSYDLKYMESFPFAIADMYFEPFLPDFGPSPIFFDLGAFDGINSEAFLSRYPQGSCYLFEPIPAAKEMLAIKFADRPCCHVVSAAVGNRPGQVTFDVSGTSSHVVDDQSDGVLVDVVSIDSYVDKFGVVPLYIKMDVEGFEPEVLEGAIKTITKYRPSLAVSVYHSVEHLVDLPLLLGKWVDGYRFYLRHYTQGYSETVLFAVAE